MDDEFLLAINGEWDALLAALRENRMLAHQTDSNGMTLLHWVCLHQDIPTEVLIKIVFANPHAVNLPNEAGHLPIDLAVQAECEERILEVLRAADASRRAHEPEPSPLPPAAYSPSYDPRSQAHSTNQYVHGGFPEEDMTFENPRYFGNTTQQVDNGVPPSNNDLSLATNFGLSGKPLYSIYSGAPHPGEYQSKSLSMPDERYRRQEQDAASVATEEYNSRYQPQLDAVSDSHVLNAARVGNKWQPSNVVGKTCFPPRWKQSRSCHVCTCRFTLTKRRHHCRNCGFSVCSQHSTNRVALPKYDLNDPQRVCDKCFLGGRHLTASNGAPSEQQYDQFRTDSFGSFRP